MTRVRVEALGEAPLMDRNWRKPLRFAPTSTDAVKKV